MFVCLLQLVINFPSMWNFLILRHSIVFTQTHALYKDLLPLAILDSLSWSNSRMNMYEQRLTYECFWEWIGTIDAHTGTNRDCPGQSEVYDSQRLKGFYLMTVLGRI